MPLVFISYSSNDRFKAERLAKALDNEKDINVWIDTKNILPGDEIIEEMKKGIERSDKFILCLSPSFTLKPPTSWVKSELKMAILKENRAGKNVIIPVRLKKGGEIPAEIGSKAYADLSTKKRWESNLPRLVEAIRKN
jgi:hypothetical protein